MTCPCLSINRTQIEESIKSISRFPPGFPKKIEEKNPCCQEYFDWSFSLLRKREKELEELSLSPQSTLEI